MNLESFIKESNKIEGIERAVAAHEIAAHETFLALDELKIEDVSLFVSIVAHALIRNGKGMNVMVGGHIPCAGGDLVVKRLGNLLKDINQGNISPYQAHHRYETLHPYMDGNGRSGRIIWLWHMHKKYNDEYMKHVYARGFLHSWYYQSLSEGR